MNITIVVQIADEDADVDHPTGLTSEAYDRIVGAIASETDGIVDIRQGGE